LLLVPAAMSEQLSAPRITAAYLDSFVGRLVTIVGKVTQLRGEQATIDADGVVTVVLNRVSLLPLCFPWHCLSP
jgi:replication factor A3